MTRPRLNALVQVTVRDHTYRSRVEEVDDDGLAVAAPLRDGRPVPVEPGEEATVSWATRRGPFELPVRVVELVDERPARWRVAGLGPARPVVRREYVRGGGGVPAELRAAGVPEPVRRLAVVSDLSEASLRCRVPAADFAVGEPVHVRFAVEAEPVELTGEVRAVRRDTDGHGWDLVVTYQAPERTARALRRYIFAWEAAQRRRAADD